MGPHTPCAWRPTEISLRSAASLFVTCATLLLSASSKRCSSRTKVPNQPARRRRVMPNSLRRTTKAGVKSKHRLIFNINHNIQCCVKSTGNLIKKKKLLRKKKNCGKKKKKKKKKS